MTRFTASRMLVAPLLLMLSPLAQGVAQEKAGTNAATTGISWEKDFKTAMRRAKESGKPVVVDFWAEWCSWCHKLDATTYVDPTVVELSRDFVAVKVNTEGSLSDTELSAKYGAETLPTIGFLTPGGRLFLRRSGFEGPETFPATLREARALAADAIAFETALARNGKDAAALAGLGLLLSEQKLHAESLPLLRDARKNDTSRPAPERKRTRRALALAEAARGKHEDAEKLLEEAVAIQPAEPDEDAAALLALGELHVERKQPEKARAALQRLLQMAPQGEVARRASEALARLPRP
jgi:thiol:disulfide interchange protein DsbD